VCQQTTAGGNNCDAQTIKGLRNSPGAGVTANTRLGHAGKTVDYAFTVRTVLQVNLDRALDTLALGVPETGFDEALFLKDTGNFPFNLRVGNFNFFMAGGICVPDTREHISNRISYRHGTFKRP